MISQVCLQEKAKNRLAGPKADLRVAWHTTVQNLSRFQWFSFLGVASFHSSKGQGGMNKPRLQKKREKRIYKEESNLYCIRDASPVSVMNFACVGVSAAFRCVRRGCANENGKVKEYQGKLIEKKKKKNRQQGHAYLFLCILE